MWTHISNTDLANEDWRPNHFVYLLKKENEIAQVAILHIFKKNKLSETYLAFLPKHNYI